MKWTWFDGGSGAEIVALPRECAEECSHLGPCDDDVAAWVDRVEWIADDETILLCLRSYGAWDDEELADSEQNRHRALWLAAGDIADRPEDFCPGHEPAPRVTPPLGSPLPTCRHCGAAYMD